MATRIIIKNSAVEGKIPADSDLATAELAINLADKKLYSKDAAGEVFQVSGGANVGNGEDPPTEGNEVGDLWWTGNFLLVWNGTAWQGAGSVVSVNDQVGAVVLELGDLEAVTLGTLNNGDIISWNGTAWVNSAAPPADISGSSISALADVEVTDAEDGEILEWQTDKFVNVAPPSKTSDFENDGEDGENPFITAADIPDIPEDVLKSGDNVSELVNDAGYLVAADVDPGPPAVTAILREQETFIYDTIAAIPTVVGGVEPVVLTYQWSRELGVITSETIIEGATNQTYYIPDDTGWSYRCEVKATDADGNEATAYTPWTGGVSFRPTSVNSITAGAGIDVEPEDGTGNVTITANVDSLSFEGTLDVTTERTDPFGDISVFAIQEFYVNVGSGKFHPSWVEVTDDVTTDTDANPGDYMIFNQTSWSYIPAGQPPSADGKWVEDSGNLYPATLSNKVGIGTTDPQKGLHISGSNNDSASILLQNTGEVGGPSTQHIAAGLPGVRTDGISITDVLQSKTTFRIDSAGNIGVGTSSPEDKLHVMCGTYDPNQDGGIRYSLGTNLIYRTGVKTTAEGTSRFFIEGASDNSGGTTEAMCVRGNGYIGINTTAPSTFLHVYGGSLGDDVGDTVDIARISQNDGNFGNFYFSSTRKVTGTDWNSVGSRLRYQVDATPMGYIEFNPQTTTAGDGSQDVAIGSNLGEVIRFKRNGKVGIGLTTPTSDLHVKQSADNSGLGFRVSRSNLLATYCHWVDSSSTYSIGYANPSTAAATPYINVNSSGQVGIGQTASTPRLTLAGQGEDGELLRLETDRSWGFYQRGANATASLDLYCGTASKAVSISCRSSLVPDTNRYEGVRVSFAENDVSVRINGSVQADNYRIDLLPELI